MLFEFCVFGLCLSMQNAGDKPLLTDDSTNAPAVERSEVTEKFFVDSFNFNYEPGTVDCRPGAPKKPIPGVELVEVSTLPLNPHQNGMAVFNLTSHPSKSCLTFEYNGLKIDHTRTADKSTQTAEEKSAMCLMHSSSVDIKAGVAFHFLGVDGGASMGFVGSRSMEKDESSEQKWGLTSVSQIDNVLAINPEVDGGPPLSEGFMHILDNNCFNPLENLQSPTQKTETLQMTCFPSLFQVSNRVCLECKLGSCVMLVSAHSSWLFFLRNQIFPKFQHFDRIISRCRMPD
jgi:hypothetical protein